MTTKSFGKPVVAELDEPGVTKASRENLHDTTHAGSLGDFDNHYLQYRRCVDAFEEIVSEYTEPYDVLGQKRLSGEDIYKAFLEGIKGQQNWHKAEMKTLDDLIDFTMGTRPIDLG
jgi:hypothetical protein